MPVEPLFWAFVKITQNKTSPKAISSLAKTKVSPKAMPVSPMTAKTQQNSLTNSLITAPPPS